MDTPHLNILSLCSGAGQLDIGIAAALARRGIRARHVAYCEREAAACATLRSRMEEQALEPAPIWGGNLQTFPAASFHGMVDAVSAGFPCQPFSGAGLQLGPEDERHLLPAILDIGDTVGASALFLENVSGLKKWFDHIATLLLQRGWHLEWGTLRAADVGAGHRRERWFGVAYREHVTKWAKRGIGPWGRLHASNGGVSQFLADGLSAGSRGHERDGDRGGESRWVAPEPPGSAAQGGDELGDPARDDERRSADGAHRPGEPHRGSGGGLGNMLCPGCGKPAETHEGRGVEGTGSGVYRTLGSAGGELADNHGRGFGTADLPETTGWRPDSGALRGGLPIFAPGPSDPRWSGILARFPLLAPALPVSPVAMRAAWGRILGRSGVEAEPGLYELADGMAPSLEFADTFIATRADHLRIAGNGVCPQQAEWAYHQLLTRILSP